MGVNGLWKLLEPVGRPVTLESLENKILAVDISVWLNQALYGMKNQQGNTIPNAHLVLLFQRICKLLFYKIKPIFVFDGGVPELKKKTMAARREIRLSARHRAQKISDKVLKTFIKSHAISSVTGRGRSAAIPKEAEPEQDLFELPPLPKEKEMKSSSEDESFYQEQHLQDIQGMNIDSENFKNLPSEIQHEIIVEMHEKSKRHSRYQAIDMPEGSDDFSTFQLNHLLKRGKLTQRLGIIRKEMNERRAGEVVQYVGETAVGRSSIIQSQKIMSEESGHYILIKRVEQSKGKDSEVPNDAMAGGFFREHPHNEQHEKPFTIESLPEISKNVAEGSVSHALDENTSSTDGGSSVGHGFQDVADLSVLSPMEARNPTILKNSQVLQLSSGLSEAKEFPETFDDRPGAVLEGDKFYCEHGETYHLTLTKESKANDDSVVDNKSDIESFGSVIECKITEMLSTEPQSEYLDIGCKKDLSPTNKSPADMREMVKVCETDSDLDDIEKEIMQRKNLIEKLLSSRGDFEKKENAKIKNKTERVMSEDGSCGDDYNENTDSQKSIDVSKIDDLTSRNGVKNKTINVDNDEKTMTPAVGLENVDGAEAFHAEKVSPVITVESVAEIQPAVNEFEGITYEELGDMQERFNEDLENLKEERSRQSRLAATVSDEMYKDSQELLQLFGIPYVISPMEAEAQCATLNANKLCEGSITEDSDIMLFGGKKVYKNVFNQNKSAELYQEADVKTVLGLDRLNLIAIALLTGSDYTEGVQGIGVVSAMEIINEFSGEGIEKLINFKMWWDETGKHGSASQESKIKRKLRNIPLPVGFPSQQVFDAYLNPAVDDSTETFSWASPDLHSLRLYASEKLGWSKSKTDEILLPVLKRLNSRETQSKIDAFFPVQFNEKRKIKSRRVKRVVNRLVNKELSADDSTEKNLKANLKRRKRKTPLSCETSCRSYGFENMDLTEETSQNKKSHTEKRVESCVKANVSEGDISTKPGSFPRNTQSNSSADSTSDTSDDDITYVPFKNPASRGRGGRTTPRVSRRKVKNPPRTENS